MRATSGDVPWRWGRGPDCAGLRIVGHMRNPIEDLAPTEQGQPANGTVREELLDASDAEIGEAVEAADPMVLRGLIYQLTGDPEIAATKVVVGTGRGFSGSMEPTPESTALIRRKAAEFLRSYRDAGAGELEHRSDGPTAEEHDPDHGQGHGARRLRPVARRTGPEPMGTRPGMVAGAAAARAPLLGDHHRCRHGWPQRSRAAQARRHRVLGDREERRCRRHLARESLPGGACRHAEPAVHARLRVRLQLPVFLLSMDREPEVLRLGGRHVRCAR